MKKEGNIMAGRPGGSNREVTGKAKKIEKHGSGLGTGPVGSTGGMSGQNVSQGGSGSSGGGKRSGGGMNPLVLIVVIVIALMGGGGGLSSLLGGGSSDNYSTGSSSSGSGYSQSSGSSSSTFNNGGSGSSTGTGSNSGGSSVSSSSSSSGNGSSVSGSSSGSSTDFSNYGALASLFGNSYSASDGAASANTSAVNTSVAGNAREKRTKILGGNRDSVTIMVYMCGTDLESRSGMATSDLQEMINSGVSNINLIVYTGGCKRWQNNVVSSSVNQIYQIQNGGLKLLVKDAGRGSMTDPSTLASFIAFGAKNFPANRMNLIFWDHGGGSVSGYGYDEKQGSGSMTLAGINKALNAAGVTFDFIGFDTCLMATAENALMMDSYADYMIASEETEPGVGWYYTDWLKKYSANTSMPTVEIGKNIVDDFVRVCASRCRGQETTLSVIDLAELSQTVPEQLKGFSHSVTNLISEKQYTVVSTARNRAKEFAPSARIDQVDLIDLAEKMGTSEGQNLATALRNAIKYNKINNITNAYGVSIYFPYRSASKVDSACSTYNAIGMDSSYADAIKAFASLQMSGQAAAGGTLSPLGSLLGYPSGGSSQSSYNSDYSADTLGSLLGALLGGGDFGSISGLDASNTGFFSGRVLGDQETQEYISDNHLDADQLIWTEEDGEYKLRLSDQQWEYIYNVDKDIFVDDGEGFIELGLDSLYNLDDSGAVIANTDKAWMSINDQVVPFYREYSVYGEDSATTYGFIPVLLNGERAELLVVLDEESPYGRVIGARSVYLNGETDTVAKNMTELQEGDRIQPVCDYYTYDGQYQNSYELGDELVWSDDLQFGYSEFSDQGAVRITYCITDLYQNRFWTPYIAA